MKRRPLAVWVIASLLLLVGSLAIGEYRDRVLPERPPLPVAFEHGDHAGVGCADCHHNFIDGSGGGACYNCHKMDPEINREMEQMFHDFCRACHLKARLTGEESGPLRQCSLCHHNDQQAAF